MSVITIDQATAVPTREDGSNFPYALIHSGGAAASFADTVTELVGVLIDGYDVVGDGDEGDRDAFALRHAHAKVMADVVQRVAVSRAETTPSDDDLAVLMEDKDTPFDGAEGSDDPFEWGREVPLVVLTTSHQPYTSVPRPSGNILVLDPTDELSYLHSLARVGLVEFFVKP